MSSNWESVWSNALQAAEGIVKAQASTARATVKAVAAAREHRRY